MPQSIACPPGTESVAAIIGRLARELRDAIEALDTFNRQASSAKAAADSRDPQRARLVDAAAYALWNFVVQRECSGFGEMEQVLKDYRGAGGGARENGSGSVSRARPGRVTLDGNRS